MMQYIKLPSSILKKIDQIQWNFIWASSSSKRKLQLVSWDEIMKSKGEEGLDIQYAKTKKISLIVKTGLEDFHKSLNSLGIDSLVKIFRWVIQQIIDNEEFT